MKQSRLWKFIFISFIIHIIFYVTIPGNLFKGNTRAISFGDEQFIQEVALVELNQSSKQKGSLNQPPKPREKSIVVKEEKKSEKPPVSSTEKVNSEKNSLKENDSVKEKELQKPVETSEKNNVSTKVTKNSSSQDNEKNEVTEGDEKVDVITSEKGKEEFVVDDNNGENDSVANKGEGKEGKANKEKVEKEEKFVPPPPESMVRSSTYITYPKDAVNQGLEGEVKIMVKVDAAGETEKVILLEESGIEEFDRVSRIIERYWQFKPSLYPYELQIRVIFNLDEGRPRIVFEKVDFDKGGSEQ